MSIWCSGCTKHWRLSTSSPPRPTAPWGHGSAGPCRPSTTASSPLLRAPPPRRTVSRRHAQGWPRPPLRQEGVLSRAHTTENDASWATGRRRSLSRAPRRHLLLQSPGSRGRPRADMPVVWAGASGPREPDSSPRCCTSSSWPRRAACPEPGPPDVSRRPSHAPAAPHECSACFPPRPPDESGGQPSGPAASTCDNSRV